MREILSMNLGWKFQRGEIENRNLGGIHEARFLAAEWMKAGNHMVSTVGYPDADWRSLDLPHDFVIESEFSPEANQVQGSLPKDVAWYRKVFMLPESDEGKRLSLEFDGVFRDCSVWLNGHFIGRQLSGYLSFAFDITEACNFGGPNALAVRADSREFELWSYEGGGIYRDVRIVKTPPVHVAHWGTFVRASIPHQPDPSEAQLSIRTEIRNAGEEAVTCEVLSEVLDPDGAKVGEYRGSLAVGAGELLAIDQAGILDSPRLWDLDTPNLYRLKTSVLINGEPVDRYETSFGVRALRFDPKEGFFLNGQWMKLKGVCDHQDHAGVGMAIPGRLDEWRVEQLKAMGCNALRTSHNQPSPALLDICDRLGMMVMDETRLVGASSELLGQLEGLIRRDRNHPSVILWSLGNEEMGVQETKTGVRQLRAMQNHAHRLDPTRLCTYAANCDFNEIADLQNANGFRLDVFGSNYVSRHVDGVHTVEGERYDEFYAKYPDWPLIATESGGSTAHRGVYSAADTDPGVEYDSTCCWHNPERKHVVSAYNETCTPWGYGIEQTWKDCVSRPFLAGTFLWTGFDYRGETYPCSWPAVVTGYGIMDLCGFPKDAFYYFQSWWTDQPVLHLFPHWNWQGSEGEPIDVWCYSNCAEVELMLNGNRVGRQGMEKDSHLEWKVPFEPGRLEAIGFDATGKEILRTVVETAGEPAGIRLTADRSEIAGDGEDLAIVRAEVVDAAGNVVPRADNRIDFRIEGNAGILGVGNGNPTSHEPDQVPFRKAFNGLCQVLILAGTESGSFSLIASSPGLSETTLSIGLTEAAARPTVESVSGVGTEQSGSGGVNPVDGAL